MKRNRRTSILIEGCRELPGRLAKQITERYPVVTVEEPNHGLVMIKARESAQRSLFYLGEVFITECKVQLQQVIGLGIVKGHEPELAYELAVIDAAYQARLPEVEDWQVLLEQEEGNISAQTRSYQQKVLQTKVDFETMNDGE
jgi:alpha-D-ribose 1-methylphosphonate 5-triphosphate synthase subunit PhnG